MALGRKISGVLRSAITAPPLVGALYVLGLAAWAGRRAKGDDAELGDVRRAEAIAAFIEKRFAAEIARMTIGIVATAVAIGLVVGLVADALIRIRARTRAASKPRPTTVLALFESAAVVFAVHASLVLWAMADSPQLYAARWYALGGWPRTVQVIATDVLGPHGVVLVALLSAVVYVRPRRLVVLVRRALSPVRRALLALAPIAGLALLAPFAAKPAREALASPAAAPSSSPSPSSAQRMNVLILAADSLRADRIEPRVAPHLARLAAKGTKFEHAYVSIPRTFPSWVTILTGRYSHHHGIRSMFPTWEDRAKDFDAMPERFAKAGYETGVVSDYAGDIFGRIDLGFARVDTPSFDFRQLIRQRALERETPLLPVLHSRLGRRLFPVMRELNDAADPNLLAGDVERALEASKDRPFFLTVFFSTAHFPYAAPAPYYAKYTDPSYRGRFKYDKPVGLGEDAPPDADDVRQIRALYDGSVSAIDDAAGRVLASLERLGVADRTIVVVTADHGETLYDNGHGQGHGDHLFGDEGTHVPLVVYVPGRAPHVEPHVVRDVDLAPTLYDLTGVAAPHDLDGRSLAPAVDGQPIDPRLAFAETELWFTEDIPALPPDLRMPYPGIMALTELDSRHNAEIVLRRDVVAQTLMARHRMVKDDRWKLLYVPTRKGVKYMLFDVVADPAEIHDVARAHPEEVTRLEAELWRWMLEDPQMDKQGGFLVPRDPAAYARRP
jgi:arylsulfatase A-like enzyme